MIKYFLEFRFHRWRPRSTHRSRAMPSMAVWICFASILTLPSSLVAQLPYGTFTSHTDGQTVAVASTTIRWKGCSNATQTGYLTRLNGVTLTTTQSNTLACPDYSIGKNYSAPATFTIGSNTLYLNVCDVSGCGNTTITVYYYPPGVSVTPDAGTGAPIVVGAQGSYVFKVNNTGGAAATVSMTATCSGAIGSCSASPSSPSIGARDSANVTVTYTGVSAGSGTATLTAAYGSVSDNGSVSVAVTDPNGGGTPTITAVTAGRNPGTIIDRDRCLTVSAGQNAAYECGDLRIVHALPATATMDRARAPALIYNSRHANPGALLAADVTYTGTAPTILRATVTMTGQSNIIKDFNWNSACANTTCRVVVPISTAQATGLYPVALSVAAMNGTTTLATSSTVTDTVVIVNRTSSPYGRGWWIDGVESLSPIGTTAMLWIGGDGTSRLYSRSSDSTVYTVSPTYDRPDTLKRVLSAGTWRRLLGDSAYVEFNSSGQQVKTVNSLSWATTFAYSGGLLQSITLPVPSISSELRRYNFFYTSSVLDSVQAPTASFARTTRAIHDGSSRLTSITDPDGYSVAFGYDGSSRMTTRRNKLSDTTYFAYDDAGALKQSSLSMARTDGPDSSITTNFRAAETRGSFDTSDLPTPLASAYTHIDGPRIDVADTTNFLVNRRGSPDSVTNALGQRTRMQHANATFPALVTNVIVPGGFETRAFINARGLVDSTVAVNPYGLSSNATTKFTWNSVWNQVDSVIGPTGERTRTFFNASRPIPDSMRVGTNVNRRVVFHYTGDNQLRSVKNADGGADSVVYDALGNSVKTYTPVGRAASTPYFTQSYKDAIGRDTLLLHPISGDTTNSTRFIYDAADRLVETILQGPARPYSLPLNPSFQPDTAAVTALTRTDTTGYDAEGNLTYKRSLSAPQTDAQLNEQMTYDAAGRLKGRRVGTGPDSLVYDRAGNVVAARQRSGLWVNQTYDALNRLVQRAVPEITHTTERCTHYSPGPLSGSTCLMIFPFYPNSGTSLVIPADTSLFVYDSAGNMTNASNRYARVRRTYFSSGAIKTDTTAIGVYSNPLLDGETKGQQYSYDLAGRRTSMQWPLGPTNYSYNDFGALSSITDASSNAYRFTYGLQSRLDSLVFGTGVREKRSYDDDGRFVFKNRVSDYSGLGLLVTDSLSYDKADHVIRVWQEAHSQAADQTLISYDGLGAVLAREQGNSNGSNVEEFRNDAFGNVIRKMNRRSAGLINTAPFTLSYSVTGALTSWHTTLTGSSGQYDRNDDLAQELTSGRLLRQDEIIRDPNSGTVSLELAARHYYGADDRLMAVQRYSYRDPGFQDGTWEEYWYDALGRRVLTRARREPSTTYDATVSGPLCVSTTVPVCRSFTERVWWDGDQSLVEERTAEGTSDVSNSGTVGNIHALTLDEPIAVITTNPSTETRIINYNWRGQGMSSVYPSGQGADASLGNAVAEIDWPAATQAETYFTPALGSTTDNNAKKWLGTFVQNGIGTTGMLYRRNRYFDTNTGRFTQEDPIGIAGGVNQYGFAAGDPVNFSDPFGLCTTCGTNPLEPRRYQPGILGTLTAGVGDAARKWWAVHGPDVIQFGLALVTDGLSLEGEGVAFRPDIKLIGGRSGGKIATLEGPPNSYVRGGGSRVFQTNESGRIVRDISPERVKVLQTDRNPNGEIFRKMTKIGPPTEGDIEILRRMGVNK